MTTPPLSLPPSLGGSAADCDVPEGALVARLAGVKLFIHLLEEEAFIETSPGFNFDCLRQAVELARRLDHELMEGWEATEDFEDGRVRHWLVCTSDINLLAEQIKEGKEMVA